MILTPENISLLVACSPKIQPILQDCLPTYQLFGFFEIELDNLNQDSVFQLMILEHSHEQPNGFEIYQQVKQSPTLKSVPTIFVIDTVEPKIRNQIFEGGGIDYLLIPLEKTEVITRISRYLTLQVLQKDYQSQKKYPLLDDVTQVASSQILKYYLWREWRRAAREKTQLSILFCDIDHLNHYNEHHGLQTGDYCLQQVAHIIHQCIRRPADLLARIEGGEFVVLLPNTHEAGALQVAENIRQSVENSALRYLWEGKEQPITLSIGISTTVPSHQYLAEDLIQVATRALQKAKQYGRNRIVTHCFP